MGDDVGEYIRGFHLIDMLASYSVMQEAQVGVRWHWDDAPLSRAMSPVLVAVEI